MLPPLAYSKKDNYRSNIDYSSLTSIDASGNRLLLNSGIDNKLSEMNHGRCIFLDGINNEIIIDIKSTIKTIYKMINSVGYYEESEQYIDSYTISDEGIHSNYIFYNGLFSQDEKEYLLHYPEKFLYIKDGLLKSHKLNQSKINNIVSYIPMCDVDYYVRDLAKYSHGYENEEVVSFTSVLSNGATNTISNISNVCNIVMNEDSLSASEPYFLAELPNYVDAFIIEVSVSILSGTAHIFEILIADVSYSIDEIIGVGDYFYIVVGNPADFNATPVISIIFNGTSESIYEANVTLITRKISGISKITNRSISNIVANVKSGIQACMLSRDKFGMPYGSSSNCINFDSKSIPVIDIPISDLYLNGDSGKFAIEFSINRESIMSNVAIIDSVVDLTGIKINTSRDYSGDAITVTVFDGLVSSSISSTLESNVAGFIQIESDGVNISMYLNGVLSETMAYLLTPSGSLLSSSIETDLTGSLSLFKIWYGENYENYNASKSLEIGLKANDIL